MEQGLRELLKEEGSGAQSWPFSAKVTELPGPAKNRAHRESQRPSGSGGSRGVTALHSWPRDHRPPLIPHLGMFFSFLIPPRPLQTAAGTYQQEEGATRCPFSHTEHRKGPPLPSSPRSLVLFLSPPSPAAGVGYKSSSFVLRGTQSLPSPPASPPVPWCSFHGCTFPSIPVGRGKWVGVLGPDLGQLGLTPCSSP